VKPTLTPEQEVEVLEMLREALVLTAVESMKGDPQQARLWEEYRAMFGPEVEQVVTTQAKARITCERQR